MLEEKYYKVWLSLIRDIGIKRYINLINHFKTDKGIFLAKKSELMQVKLINEKIVQDILSNNIKKEAERHLKYMEVNKIDIISIADEDYPYLLREIYSPPVFLYIRGNKSILNDRSIAIVGCRDCSNYGKKVSQKLAYDLSNNNLNIVSGLAKGIDSYAHFGAICGKASTISVLGSGVDTIYPQENYKLAEKILEKNGAIISEYPIASKIEKMNFPARNRIISGISSSIIVVEAKKKSGTLITVDFALEQGREVFVVPRKY